MTSREEAIALRIVPRLSAQKAALRFKEHMDNWSQHISDHRDFYAQVINRAMPGLSAIDAEVLRKTWALELQYMDATSDEQRTALDREVGRLYDDHPTATNWVVPLTTNCKGGYFTAAIDAEMADLAKVPGIEEELERMGILDGTR